MRCAIRSQSVARLQTGRATSSMNEYTFDLDRWIDLFRLESMQKLYGAITTTSPNGIAIVEQLRARARAEFDLGPTAPTDVFAYAQGEPARREVTKFGGLPYRPADKPWPKEHDGKLMTFLLQFCFADSKDIVRKLPGDVLVVFVRTARPLFVDTEIPEVILGDQACLVCEWYPLGLDRLVQQDEVPPPRCTLPICYGVGHRSMDYLNEEKVAEAIGEVFPDQRPPEDEFDRIAALNSVRAFVGTKIGGVPYWHDPKSRLTQLPGRFVASFAGIMAEAECHYPWVNRPEPIPWSQSLDDENFFIFCDGCIHYFFVDDQLNTHWRAQLL